MLFNFGKQKKLPSELISEMFIDEEEYDSDECFQFDDPLKKVFHSSFESIKHFKWYYHDTTDEIKIS